LVVHLLISMFRHCPENAIWVYYAAVQLLAVVNKAKVDAWLE